MPGSLWEKWSLWRCVLVADQLYSCLHSLFWGHQCQSRQGVTEISKMTKISSASVQAGVLQAVDGNQSA